MGNMFRARMGFANDDDYIVGVARTCHGLDAEIDGTDIASRTARRRLREGLSAIVGQDSGERLSYLRSAGLRN